MRSKCLQFMGLEPLVQQVSLLALCTPCDKSTPDAVVCCPRCWQLRLMENVIVEKSTLEKKRVLKLKPIYAQFLKEMKYTNALPKKLDQALNRHVFGILKVWIKASAFTDANSSVLKRSCL